MSTFEPVYAFPYDYGPEAPYIRGPLMFVGGHDFKRGSAYFWDVDSDDDFKPVVHSKWCVDGHPCQAFSVGGKTLLTDYDSEDTPRDRSTHYAVTFRSTEFAVTSVQMTVASVTTRLPENRGVPYVFISAFLALPYVAQNRWYGERFDINIPLHYSSGYYVPGEIWYSGYISDRFRSVMSLVLGPVARELAAHIVRRINGTPIVDSRKTLLSACKSVQRLLLENSWAASTSQQVLATSAYYSAAKPITVDNASSMFLFGERDIESFGVPAYLSRSSYRYWLDWLRQHAFVDACENMPTLSDNSISNLQEVFEFLLSVIRREPPKLSLKPNELWLAYRYQYSTTKMDVQEAWAFVNRCYDLGSIFSTGVAHGQASYTFQNGVEVACRAAVEVAPNTNRWYNDLGALWRDISKLGVAPDLYYLWDSTPFSFIFDWFLPIGDVVGAFDASNLYTTENYKFGRIVYSLSYKRTDLVTPFSCYSRWVEDRSPIINPMYWIDSSGSASSRQVAYRALDAVSLIIGGIT